MPPSSKWLSPLLGAMALGFALPLAWMLLGSFAPPDQLETELWPRRWHWQNYATVLASDTYLMQLANSVGLCLGTVVGTLVSCSMAAYAFARLKWPGRDVVFLMLVATMLLPFHVTMLPRFQLFAGLGLYNTYWPLVLPAWLASEGFYVFLLRQFFLTIPEELSEAARLDGASEWTIFTRIVLPLSRPALVTVGLFQFLNTWNAFSAPLLYLNDPRKFPLAYGLQDYVSAYRTQFGPLMAAAVLFTLPAVAMFLLAQRAFVQGIATTGRKG
jgi:multiple sugar transport system permease protein